MMESSKGGFQNTTSNVDIYGFAEQDLSTFNRSDLDHSDGQVNNTRPHTYHGLSVSEHAKSSNLTQQRPLSMGRDIQCSLDNVPVDTVDTVIQSLRQTEHPADMELESLKPPPPQRIPEDFIITGWIIFFAICGALGRIACTTISTFQGQPVFSLIWAQFLGCTIMGFLVEDTTLFPKSHRYQPLYVGLSTGFCGSLTSFSTWMWDAFTAFSNFNPHFDRRAGQNILAGLTQLFITLVAVVSALRFGGHISDALQARLPMISKNGKYKQKLDGVGVILGILSWPTAIITAASTTHFRETMLVAVFAPPGAIIRWQLARFNARFPVFPIGTFAANILACIILGIDILIFGRQSTSLSSYGSAVITGIESGFCGCLSTLSTFVVELDTLSVKHAYIYAFISAAVGLVVLVLIVGVVELNIDWNVDFT